MRAGRPVRLVALLATGALAGKVLGFVREVVMARTLGATVTADSFRGSVTAVLLPLGPLLNESTPAILIPMCREWRKTDHGPRALGEMVLALGLMATAVMLLVQLSGSWWVSAVVGGFSAASQQLALEFIRVMALMMPAAVVLNCLAAADIAQGHSRIAAARAGVVNVFVTAGIGAYAVTGQIGWLPWSFAIAFNALAAWSYWLLKRDGVISFEGVSLEGIVSAWQRFMRRLRPLLAQPLAEQLHGWTERFVASGLLVGTMASIDYARTISDSAALIVAQPIGMAVLYTGALPDDKASALSLSGVVLAAALPVSLCLGMFAEDIVSLVFHRGAFDQMAVLQTSSSLRGISIGLWAATLGWILLRLLNNAGRNALAATLLAAAFLANVCMNVLAGQIAGAGGNGSFWLGLGEGVRGIVLLGAVALALGIGRPMVELFLKSSVPLVLLAVFYVWLASAAESPILRLSGGAVAAALTAALLAALLAPEAVRSLTLRLRFRVIRTE